MSEHAVKEDGRPRYIAASSSYGSRWGADRNSQAADAIDLLVQDHRTIQVLLRKSEVVTVGRRGGRSIPIFKAISKAISLHSAIEDELLLPVAAQHIRHDCGGLLENARAEQEKSKALIEELHACWSDPLLGCSMLRVLAEHVCSHMDEEERQLFPALRETGIDLEALGDRIVARKRELSGSYSAPFISNQAVESIQLPTAADEIDVDHHS